MPTLWCLLSALCISDFQQLVLCENGACQIRASYPLLPAPPKDLKLRLETKKQAPTTGWTEDSFTKHNTDTHKNLHASLHIQMHDLKAVPLSESCSSLFVVIEKHFL